MAIDVKPIRSAADHRAAMAEVKRLWGAKNGTPNGDRLDVLATLIDAYEAQHEPIDRPDPIEAIQFRMEQQGLTLHKRGRKSIKKWPSRSLCGHPRLLPALRIAAVQTRIAPVHHYDRGGAALRAKLGSFGEVRF
jgi:hypothetical protein